MLVDPLSVSQSALGDEEKAMVQEQLERLLASPHFSHSRRFPSFLRYVVERTLSGQEDSLKERTLGIEIFGRAANYDTSSDPIVRVTAAEIRKRIAQYYQSPGHGNQLRISLPAGSYIPHFHFHPPANEEDSAVPAMVLQGVPSEPHIRGIEARPRRAWKLLAAVLLVVVLAAAGGLWLWESARRSPLDFFWGPLLTSSDPVLICVADQKQYSTIALRDANDPGRQLILPDNLTAVVIDDLNPIVKVGGILQASGRKYSLRGEGAANLMDLRAGPTVFIGAFDNAWTLLLTRPLRYHFANNPEMTQFRIVDTKAPSATRWMVDRPQQMATDNYRDYGIIARFTDNTTGKLAVIAAGISRGGTIAAGEFLTDPTALGELRRLAQAAGNKRNMEVVISTQIIGGEPGSPKVEAAYFW
jgi:hypothetical protein